MSEIDSSSSDEEEKNNKQQRDALVRQYTKLQTKNEKALKSQNEIEDTTMFTMERAESVNSMLSDDDLKIRMIHVSKPNTRQKKFMCFCKRIVPAYRGNLITTSKYNFVTFLPLNLML